MYHVIRNLVVRYCFALLITFQAISQMTFAQAPYAGKMGVNLDIQYMYVNLADQGYRWRKVTGSPGSFSYTSLITTDVDPATGWPNKDCEFINDERPPQEWFNSIDDPTGYRVDVAGTYACSFTGQASLSMVQGPGVISNVVYNSGSNTTTFTITMPPPGPQHGLMQLVFYNTKLTAASPVNTGIRNVRINRPGYPLSSNKIISDPLMNALKSANFAAVRHMAPAEINNAAEYNGSVAVEIGWSKRKIAGQHASRGGRMSLIGVSQGMTYEDQIAICNDANMDLWVCLPVTANDDYATQLATLIKNTLKPTLKVYVEYSNENWNFGFNQYSWTKVKAQQEVDAGGSNLNPDNRTDQFKTDFWGSRRVAKRTKEFADIFGGVFGSGSLNNRVRVVLSGKCYNDCNFIIGRLKFQLEFLAAAYPNTPPKSYLYSISDGFYHGGPIARGDTSNASLTPAQKTLIKTATVAQINQAYQETSDNDVPRRQTGIALATSYSLAGGLSSYEGGLDSRAGNNSFVNLANRVSVARTQEAANIMARNYTTNFWDLGGGLAMYFTLSSKYSRFGIWGLTDDLNQPDRNFRFPKIRELIGPVNPTSTTITFEGATTGAFAGTYTEVGYRISESQNSYYRIVAPAEGYASKIYQGSDWNRITSLRRADNTTFTLTSLQYGMNRLNTAGDAIITGTKANGSTVTAPISYSSKTLQTLTLNWTDLRKVEINHSGGINAANSAIDNIVVSVSAGAARIATEEAASPEAEPTMQVYPNPTHGQATLVYYALAPGELQVRLLSASATVLQATRHRVVEGENRLTIPLKAIPTGLYVLEASESGRRQVTKLLVE